jgi:predicted anti-sigma-YlaC factor YlaD
MDHEKAAEMFSDFLDGSLPARDKAALEQHLGVCIQCRTDLESFRRAVGSLGKLKQGAPPRFLPDIEAQIYRRSHGRFFGRRWKLFGRIPFEWVSLATIIAMLIYYIATLHGTPGGVKPAP